MVRYVEIFYISLSSKPGRLRVSSQSINSMSSVSCAGNLSPIKWAPPFLLLVMALFLSSSSSLSISISTPVSSLSTAVRLGRRPSSCQVAWISAYSCSSYCKLFSARRKLSRNSFKSTSPSLLMSIKRQISTNCSCVIGLGMYLPISWQASENSSNVMKPTIRKSYYINITFSLWLCMYINSAFLIGHKLQHDQSSILKFKSNNYLDCA